MYSSATKLGEATSDEKFNLIYSLVGRKPRETRLEIYCPSLLLFPFDLLSHHRLEHSYRHLFPLNYSTICPFYKDLCNLCQTFAMANVIYSTSEDSDASDLMAICL